MIKANTIGSAELFSNEYDSRIMAPTDSKNEEKNEEPRKKIIHQILIIESRILYIPDIFIVLCVVNILFLLVYYISERHDHDSEN